MISEPVVRHFDFEAIRPSFSEVTEIMGYKAGSEPEFLPDLVGNFLSEAANHSGAAGCFGTFKVDRISIKEGNIYFNEQQIHCGSRIARQLNGSEYLSMLIATAGSKFENWIISQKENGDIMSEYICSSVGSVIAEKIADALEDEICREANKSGMGVTNRYSPGYCNWKMQEQGIIFKNLPSEEIGVSLNSSFLMMPVKSTSAIIGIGVGVTKRLYECESCNQKDCIVRLAREK
jgi:hypothetical protein